MSTRDISVEIPEFYKMCESEKKGTDIIMHQSVFEDDSELMGEAVKYANGKGLNVTIISGNNE